MLRAEVRASTQTCSYCSGLVFSAFDCGGGPGSNLTADIFCVHRDCYKLLVFFHMHFLLFILPFIPLLYLLLLTLLHVRLFRVFSTNSQICRLGDGLRMVGLRQLAALFQWRPSRLLPFPSFPLLLPLSFPSLPLPSFPL